MPNIYRVRAVSVGWTGGPGLNTFYFRQGSGQLAGDAGDAQLCVDRVQAAFTDANELYPTQWSVQVDPVVDYINDETGELVSSYGVTGRIPVVGVGGGGFGPIAAMILLQLRTSEVVNGHRLRGRAFLGPSAVNADPDGSPSPEDLTAALQFATALLDAGVAGPQLVIWHRPRKARPLAVPPVAFRIGASRFVTSFATPEYYAVLRSRRD